MLVAYPKLLTDPAWKKVEKAAGVSSTGVGKTLRDAEKVWQTLVTEVGALEKSNGAPAKADQARKQMIVAFGKSETILKALLPKVKDAKKKKVLQDYTDVVQDLVRDLTGQFNLVGDHRGLDFVVNKFNTHVQADVSRFKLK